MAAGVRVTGEFDAVAVTRLGRYTLVKHLGTGGMAEVFLARHDGPAGFAKICVVKRIRRIHARNPHFVKMFLREARMVARLSHPNIVEIFELAEDAGEYFIAMEYVDGITVYRAARRAWARGQTVPVEVVLRVLADAALGLHHAHSLVDEHGAPSPVVHRDATPDNLMMTRDGVTKLLDFGVAKSTDVDEGTVAGEVKGKTPYLSPEQVSGQAVDGRADLWSLGVTAYWLLTGLLPFEAATDLHTVYKILHERPRAPREVNPRIPSIVSDVVMRLLSRDPAHRLASGEQLHGALMNLLGPAGGIGQVADFVTRVTADVTDAGEDDAPVQAPTVAAAPESSWLTDLDADSEGGGTTEEDRPLPHAPSATEKLQGGAAPSERLAAAAPWDGPTVRINLPVDSSPPDALDHTKPIRLPTFTPEILPESDRTQLVHPRPRARSWATSVVVISCVVTVAALVGLVWWLGAAATH